MAVASAATNARALLRILLIQHHAERRVKRPQSVRGKVVAQLLNARLVADGGIRKRAAPARLGRIFAHLAVHMIDALRLGVVRLEFVVGNRPRRRDAAVMFDFAEIFLAQPEERRAVELGVAADVVIRVRMQRLPRASRQTSFVL